MNTTSACCRSLSNQRHSRWSVLAAITVWIHLGVMLSPVQFVDLRSGLLPIEQYSILLVPSVWSIFMLLRYRERRECVVAYYSLAATLLWFGSVGFLRS